MRGGLPIQGRLAPIVLFVYNRPDHTRQTLDALAANMMANESELFIFSDAPKDESAVEKVQAVRSYIKTVQGFGKVHIVERKENWGLAKSIIEGVTDIVNQYGKIIVLEDDIVTSPYFLKFMNDALDFYDGEKSVWHISGWNYPIDLDNLKDAFFWRIMNCWGWATWKDRWNFYKKDVNYLISSFTRKDIRRFTLNNSADMWAQVIANKEGIINTWAIFWYAAIFQQKGLCLNPAQSFVKNIGLDGSGIHCGKDSAMETHNICEKEIDFNTIQIEENKIAVKKIMRFYRKQQNLKNRILRYIKKIYTWIKKWT